MYCICFYIYVYLWNYKNSAQLNIVLQSDDTCCIIKNLSGLCPKFLEPLDPGNFLIDRSVFVTRGGPSDPFKMENGLTWKSNCGIRGSGL